MLWRSLESWLQWINLHIFLWNFSLQKHFIICQSCMTVHPHYCVVASHVCYCTLQLTPPAQRFLSVVILVHYRRRDFFWLPVCVCVFASVRLRMRMCACLHLFVSLLVCACLRVHMCACMYVHRFTWEIVLRVHRHSLHAHCRAPLWAIRRRIPHQFWTLWAPAEEVLQPRPLPLPRLSNEFREISSPRGPMGRRTALLFAGIFRKQAFLWTSRE